MPQLLINHFARVVLFCYNPNKTFIKNLEKEKAMCGQYIGSVCFKHQQVQYANDYWEDWKESREYEEQTFEEFIGDRQLWWENYCPQCEEYGGFWE